MSNSGATQYCIGEMEFFGCQAAEIAGPEVGMFTCMADDAPVDVCPN